MGSVKGGKVPIWGWGVGGKSPIGGVEPANFEIPARKVAILDPGVVKLRAFGVVLNFPAVAAADDISTGKLLKFAGNFGDKSLVEIFSA